VTVERLRCCVRWIAALVLAAPGAAAEDIDFLAEHVPESGMDARYLSLPWPGGRLEPGEWQQLADLATVETRTDFIRLDGPMIAFAAAHGVSARWGYQAIGFYSDLSISGEKGRVLLAPGFLRGVPLDLPQLADFSNPRGTVRHFGMGAAIVLERAAADAPRSAQLIAGMLLERLEVKGFALDYRLAAGADAGASGMLEHSSEATFITPFVGWQQTRRLGDGWTWSPRAMVGLPLPPGDFDGRLTSPGFDLKTPRDATGRQIEIGDGFIAVGLAFAHRPSGLEVDVGGMLFYAATEHVSHHGIERAVLLHLAWRHRAR
jgi:hypothetical protein